jgi:hypothetical protein
MGFFLNSIFNFTLKWTKMSEKIYCAIISFVLLLFKNKSVNVVATRGQMSCVLAQLFDYCCCLNNIWIISVSFRAIGVASERVRTFELAPQTQWDRLKQVCLIYILKNGKMAKWQICACNNKKKIDFGFSIFFGYILKCL